jgi:hypothetical protein
MRVLVACEFSGVVRRAFRRRGHEAFSCDLLPPDDEFAPFKQHYQMDVLELLGRGLHWDLMIAHPPCTYLCRAGWRWVNAPDSSALPLKGEPRREAAYEAAEFFKALLAADVPRIAVENPRPIVHVNLPGATQYVQPWMFGHAEKKATGLWLKNLPPLVPTDVVPKELRKGVVHFTSPGPNRWKERSRTYTGLAEAMAEQWGGHL